MRHYPIGQSSSAMCVVLALDTATDACSVALYAAGDIHSRHESIPRAHNQHVLAMVREVMTDHALGDVGLFACGIGPGSFTGIRIATSVVQGLAWSTDKPALGVCSLEAQAWTDIAENGQSDRRILSTIDAQIGQLYWRWFSLSDGILTADGPARISGADDVQWPQDGGGITVVGSGCGYWETVALPTKSAPLWFPDIRPHASLIAGHLARGMPDSGEATLKIFSPADLQPQYVQQNVGWKKLSEQGPQ